MEHLCKLLRDEGGATMVEYGIVAAAIALPILAFMTIITIGCGMILTAASNGVAAIGTQV